LNNLIKIILSLKPLVSAIVIKQSLLTNLIKIIMGFKSLA